MLNFSWIPYVANCCHKGFEYTDTSKAGTGMLPRQSTGPTPSRGQSILCTEFLEESEPPNSKLCAGTGLGINNLALKKTYC